MPLPDTSLYLWNVKKLINEFDDETGKLLGYVWTGALFDEHDEFHLDIKNLSKFRLDFYDGCCFQKNNGKNLL